MTTVLASIVLDPVGPTCARESRFGAPARPTRSTCNRPAADGGTAARIDGQMGRIVVRSASDGAGTT